MIKAWRSPTGYRHDPNLTVMDVIRYETEELGNNIGFNPRYIDLCQSLPASACQWVTFRKSDAARYGQPQRISFYYPLFIAQDGDRGYLVIDLDSQILQNISVSGCL